METKRMNLYRVRHTNLSAPEYAAAEDQTEAAKKVTYDYDEESIIPETMSVEYVGLVRL